MSYTEERDIDERRVDYIRERLINVARLEAGKPAAEIIIAFAEAVTLVLRNTYHGEDAKVGLHGFMTTFQQALLDQGVAYLKIAPLTHDAITEAAALCACSACEARRGPVN